MPRRDGEPLLTEGDVNLSPRRAAWRRRLGPETLALLARDEAVFLHQSLSTPCLDALSHAEGARLTTLDGRQLIDFHGNSVHQVGFSHPEVLEAARRQMDALSFSPRRFTNEPAVALAEKLVSLAPEPLGKALFTPGGTSAVGMALKLARLATGRHKTVSLWDSFHGASLDAVSVGGEALFRAGMGPLLPGCEHAPPPEPYRCVLNPKGCRACDLTCARLIDYILDKERDVAAVVAEPFRCTTVNTPPEGFWPAVRQACDRHGALLVFDETAVCLGRAGSFFAFERFGVVPDMVTLGKGLGGGVFPLAALIAGRDLDRAGHVALGHYTHEKNPVAAAAALAAIDVIQRDGLVTRSRELGRELLERLTGWKDRHPLLGDVRGLGLALALELVTDRETKAPAAEAAEAALYACLEEGLSFKVSQGNVLTLTPPLNIPEHDLERALDILDRALARVESRHAD